jgi:hypothetical protein
MDPRPAWLIRPAVWSVLALRSAVARRTVALLAVLALVILVVAGCASPVAPSGRPSPAPSGKPSDSASAAPNGGTGAEVRVTVGIYSGRVDPAWLLSADQATTLEAIIASLPEQVGIPPEGGLGYHGFTIELPGRTLVADRGRIAGPGTGARPLRFDGLRLVERFLLESGRAHLVAAEIAAAERGLAAP